MAEFEKKYWWFLGRQKIIVSVLEKEIGPNSNCKILDIGCGTGGTTLSLNQFGSTYGIDSSFSALKYCNQRGLEKVVKSSSYELPFSSNSFDLVTILDVLEHIKNDLKVLKEVKRVLKKDGTILITVPAYQFLWSEHDLAVSHYRRYNSKTLSSIINQSGFKVVRISYFVSFLFPLLAVYRIASKLKKSKSNPKSHLIQLPTSINILLQKILHLENWILDKTNLPFGLSIVCVAKN